MSINKTEATAASSKNDNEIASSSFLSINNTGVSRRIHVKKEEEDCDNINDNVNNSNGDGTANANATTTATIRRSCAGIQQVKSKVKKEEEEEKEDDNNNPAEINNCNNKKNVDVDDYTDWTKGSWCWLLPSTSTTCNNNNNNNTNTNNTVIPAAAVSISSRKRTAAAAARRSRNTYINNNEEDTPKSKKMRLLSHPPHPPPPPSNTKNTTIVKREEEGEEEEEDSVCHNKEVNNNNGNDEDDDEDDEDEDEDDDGYGSWTEGNWCFLLPAGSSSTTTVATTTTERRKQRPVRGKHRNCHSSSRTPLHNNDALADEDNELGTGHSDNDDDDDDDDNDDDDDDNDGLNKSSTGKDTLNAYTKKRNNRWNKMFRRLVSYKKQHNSTIVPQRYAVDPELGMWVGNQRTLYRIEEISDYRLDLLNSIGFVWNMLGNQWDEMFQRLVTYKKQHGSTLVPKRYEADTQLGMWVQDQRKNHNDNRKKISVDRIKRLESIGFVWDVLDNQWLKMYNRLVAYKKKHKSTQVPWTYTDDNTDIHLGTWVVTQRCAYNNGKLLKKRMELLNSIDFAWVGERGKNISRAGRLK